MNGIPEDLMLLLDEHGVRVTGHREIDYGTQHHLSLGPEESDLNVYRTGKVSVSGKPSRLRDLLEGWRLARTKPRRAGGTGETGTRLDPTPRIGIDEAGKGDYFGPLVVAGVRISGENMARRLREVGVRDSKDLSDAQSARLASLILDHAGPDNTHVITLSPREYERRRAAAGNVNRLLGEVDAEILTKLQGEVEVVVVDEFARAARSYIEPHVPAGARLEVRVRAEDDAAVAAASILARAWYLEELKLLSERVGFELPKGSTHVLGAARRVIRERGEGELAEVAKVHFGTTEKVLGGGSSGGRRKRGS